MRRITPNPRGMALVMAMIVVVLITLLVAGAISFTGTERAASEIQTEQDVMSSCVQAARNLFLSKVRTSMVPEPEPSPTPELPYTPDPLGRKVLKVTYGEDLRGLSVRTGHLGTVQSYSAKQVSAMDDPLAQVGNIGLITGITSAPTFYIVTAVCRETADPSSPEREIEFMVRVGI